MTHEAIVDQAVLDAENRPVITFGSVTNHSPFHLAREVVEVSQIHDRRAFWVETGDPVTARCLQLWRPAQHSTKTRWLREFQKLRPGDPLLCWLVCMGAVSTVDAMAAIVDYGWLGDMALPLSTHELRGGRIAWANGVSAERMRDRILEALLDIERSPSKRNNNGAMFEWLAVDDARALLDACVIREAAEAQEKQDAAANTA